MRGWVRVGEMAGRIGEPRRTLRGEWEHRALFVPLDPGGETFDPHSSEIVTLIRITLTDQPPWASPAQALSDAKKAGATRG